MKTILHKYKWCWLVVGLIVLVAGGYIVYQTLYLDYINKIEITLNGEKEIQVEVFSEYKDEGAKATFRKKDITNQMKINGDVDTSKIGEYNITYEVVYKHKKNSEKRKIIVVDKIVPELTLSGEDKYTIYIGESWEDPGYSAVDNYDGDITDKVVVDSTLDTNTEGTYTITYTATDTSGNVTTKQREVEVKKKVLITSQGIAVLNYHFFYGEGESCNESICLSTTKFEEQLKYLKDNGYKTLTMDEFVRWMYGQIELPEKSVLLTIDDGAMGTGAHNGNKLIPLLEKYEAHATLFLITGWWDINNYQSDYLDVESHTHDMHNEGFCSGVTRGARMLCSTHDVVLADLKQSAIITGSTNAFCYPFYAYNDSAINIVKEAGFKVAFAGGGYKATRNSNKYAIPRYPIQSNISLNTFVNYIS